MKTPEEMAEEYADMCVSDDYYVPLKAGFLAGYRAAQPQWISVKDRLPEVNTWALWLYPFGPEVNQYEGKGKGDCLLFHRDYYNCKEDPSHWMPLPEAPKGEE